MLPTLQSIKENPLNRTFFDNAELMGDKSYVLNAKKDRLTVKSTVWGDGSITAISVWQVGTDGKILQRISCEFDPPVTQ